MFFGRYSISIRKSMAIVDLLAASIALQQNCIYTPIGNRPRTLKLKLSRTMYDLVQQWISARVISHIVYMLGAWLLIVFFTDSRRAPQQYSNPIRRTIRRNYANISFKIMIRNDSSCQSWAHLRVAIHSGTIQLLRSNKHWRSLIYDRIIEAANG